MKSTSNRTRLENYPDMWFVINHYYEDKIKGVDVTWSSNNKLASIPKLHFIINYG